MILTKITKVVSGLGGALLILSYPNVQARELISCHDCRMKRLPKAKELPLYDKTDDYVSEYDENSSLPLISQISTVRKEVFKYASYINVAQEQAVHFYETGVAHSKSTFDYLKEEENKVQRILIIISGGLAGLLIARKRGIFKKVLYTSFGTGITFSAFYPAISKKYIITGWNTSKEQLDDILSKYGGYDTSKFSEEVNKAVESVKSTMMLENLTKLLNENFYKKKEPKKDNESEATQSNQDMYTTRQAP